MATPVQKGGKLKEILSVRRFIQYAALPQSPLPFLKRRNCPFTGKKIRIGPRLELNDGNGPQWLCAHCAITSQPESHEHADITADCLVDTAQQNVLSNYYSR